MIYVYLCELQSSKLIVMELEMIEVKKILVWVLVYLGVPRWIKADGGVAVLSELIFLIRTIENLSRTGLPGLAQAQEEQE